MRKRTRQSLAPLLFLALLLAAACADDTTPTVGGTTPPATTSPTSTGTQTAIAVEIVRPASGASVAAGDVTVEVRTTGFSVVNKLGQTAVPGEGHVHFYKDASQIPTEPGKPAVSAQGTYHATATTTYTWPMVTAGSHTFAVQLVNNDHTPLNPPVTATVTVTVQ